MSKLESLIASYKVKSIIDLLSQDNLMMLLDNDQEQTIVYANENMFNLFEYKRLIGKSVSAMTHSIGEFFKENHEKLKTFRENKRSSSWLVIAKHEKSAKYSLVELTDYPIWNDDKLVGSYVKVSEQNFSAVKQMMKFLTLASSNGYSLRNSEPAAKLSPLENEILFLLMLGKSPKEIAQIEDSIVERDINCSTISSIINKRIYNKLDAISVSTAIQNALLNDTLLNIPENFLAMIKESFFFINSENKSFSF